MAADRGAFIDQTQSMNIFMDSPNFAKLTAMHFWGWGRRNLMTGENGEVIIPQGENIEVIYDADGTPKCYRDKRYTLKTGIYYLRRKAKHQAQQFTIEPEKKTNNADVEEVCEMCSA